MASIENREEIENYKKVGEMKWTVFRKNKNYLLIIYNLNNDEQLTLVKSTCLK